jgi:hypothetical protein
MAKDLNDHELGVIAFRDKTENIPTFAGYGICIGIGGMSSWLWQIAMYTTSAAIYVRRRINDENWTAWVAL